MKFNGKRLGAIAVSFLLFVASAFNATSVPGEESAPKTTTFLSVVVPSIDSAWNAAESLGAEMKYLEAVQALREIALNDDLFKTIDASKPLELYVASDGNEIFGYGRLSLVGTVDDSVLADLKAQIAEKDDKGILDEVFVEDSKLYVCSSKHKSLVPTGAPSSAPDYDKDAVLVVDANVGAVPRELLEAGFAVLRQQLADAATEDSEVALEDLEAILVFYSEIIDSLDDIRYTVRVDAAHNLVVTLSVVAKPEGELARLIEKARVAKTRWNVVANTPNAILAAAGSDAQSDAIKKFQINQYKNVTSRNILNQLDVLIDSPDDFEVAKELVKAFDEEFLASLESGTSDAGIAFCADPVLFDFTWTLCKPEEFKKALRTLFDHLVKNDPSVAKYVALDVKTVEGFAVSELNLKIDELGEDAPEYLKGKTLTARLGVDDGSAVFVLGLNVADVEAEFARVAKGSKEVGDVQHRVVFDFAPLALLIYDFVSSEGNARPVALKTLEKIGESEGVRFVSTQRFSENRIDVDFIVEKGLFQTLGDVIRINLTAGSGEVDEGEDLDDLFEE